MGKKKGFRRNNRRNNKQPLHVRNSPTNKRNSSYKKRNSYSKKNKSKYKVVKSPNNRSKPTRLRNPNRSKQPLKNRNSYYNNRNQSRYTKNKSNDGKVVLILVMILIAFGIGAIVGADLGINGMPDDNNTTHVENVTVNMTQGGARDPYSYNIAQEGAYFEDYNALNSEEYR